MMAAISVLGAVGFASCYEMAMRMTAATRHSIRLALILVGIGCAMLAVTYWHPDLLRAGTLTLLVGVGLFRLLDRRKGGGYGNGNPSRADGVADLPVDADRAGKVVGQIGPGVHRYQHAQARRQGGGSLT